MKSGLIRAQKITEISALSLLLYPFQFERVSEDFLWTEDHHQKLSKLYDINKLKIILEQLDHYFMVKDIDLSNVLPSMNANDSQKEILLKHIQKGLKEITDYD